MSKRSPRVTRHQQGIPKQALSLGPDPRKLLTCKPADFPKPYFSLSGLDLLISQKVRRFLKNRSSSFHSLVTKVSLAIGILPSGSHRVSLLYQSSHIRLSHKICQNHWVGRITGRERAEFRSKRVEARRITAVIIPELVLEQNNPAWWKCRGSPGIFGDMP